MPEQKVEPKVEPKWREASFKQLGIPCFFDCNGLLHCKIDDNHYIRFDFNRQETKIIEWDKNDFISCHPVDLSYQYQRVK